MFRDSRAIETAPSGAGRRRGFTLVELLATLAILTILIVLTAGLVNGITTTVQRGSAQLERVNQAQRAFDLLRQTLGEATLRPYYDYVDSTGKRRSASLEAASTATNIFVPFAYARASELRFIAGPATPPAGTAAPPGAPKDTSLNLVSPFKTATPNGATPVTHGIFFQTPSGRTNKFEVTPLRTLLNTVGFYVEYGQSADLTPPVPGALAGARRFRLMMLTEPTENLGVYYYTQNSAYTAKDWYTVPMKTAANVHLLAENIVALVVRPKAPSGVATAPWTYFPPYPYDTAYNNPAVGSANWTQSITQHQLPPVVEMTLVAIDPTSAQRLEAITGGNSLTALGLANLFADPSDVTYAASMNTLTTYLIDHHITYRTFVTDVSLGGAKW